MTLKRRRGVYFFNEREESRGWKVLVAAVLIMPVGIITRDTLDHSSVEPSPLFFSASIFNTFTA